MLVLIPPPMLFDHRFVPVRQCQPPVPLHLLLLLVPQLVLQLVLRVVLQLMLIHILLLLLLLLLQQLPIHLPTPMMNAISCIYPPSVRLTLIQRLPPLRC